jgi:septal ring-binding cell division protein DamX
MASGPDLRCPRCSAGVQPGQEYCLDCGGRLGPVERDAATRASTAAASRWGSAAAWAVPALLALLVAAIGTGAAIAISNEGDAPQAISVATGGTRTVTEATPTVTAPEPPATTAATTAPPATTTPPATTAPPKPPPVPAAITWPRDRRGWTIVLLSVPTSNGRDAAAEQATRARGRGLRRVGVLDSSRYASLHPGYYVVFQGVFDSEAEAASALQRARAVFPNAYQREIVP